MNKTIKNIIFDFDGVIIDSMSIRDVGFYEVLANYNVADVEKLMTFHRENGGLSRYVKFKYFFENILNESISEKQVSELADHFSSIMKSKLTNPIYLIKDVCKFIERECKQYNMFIASGSDEIELNFLCERLGISCFFKEIKGSPKSKDVLISEILYKYNCLKSETIVIGDSVNDYDAAIKNGIRFYGYNNINLESVSDLYIKNFNTIRL